MPPSRSRRSLRSKAEPGGGEGVPRLSGVPGTPSATVRILGIDPGSRITGYGVIECTGTATTRHRHLASGCIDSVDGDTAERLSRIAEGLREIVAQHAPDELAIERVFVSRNVESALKLGQARGAALVAVSGLPVSEYAPTRIKQATTGSGKATKAQVQHMVRVLLSLPETPRPDAADALAVALCHAHTRTAFARLQAVGYA